MNLDFLLEPISEQAPAGIDLRRVSSDLTLEQIRELRSEMSPEEDWAAGQGKDPDWSGIVATCESALVERTKDLEIANALTEAWARTLGYPGLATGLELVRELCERFWSCIHPGCEDGSIITPLRARHLTWLGGSEAFLYSVRHTPLLHRPDGQTVSWAQRLEALRTEALRLTSPVGWKEAQARGALSLEDLEALLAATPTDHFETALYAVDAARSELARLEEFCVKCFDGDAQPDLLPLRDLLDEIADFLRARIPQATATAVPEPRSSPESEVTRPAHAPPAAPLHQPIETRADALRMLGELATYFRRTEPHSPVSYLVQRAVRWGEMPLEHVLKEVVKDPNVLSHIWDTLGITPPED